MKRSLFVFAMAVTIIGAWSLGRVQGQKSEEKVIFASSAKADYKPRAKGVSAAAIFRPSPWTRRIRMLFTVAPPFSGARKTLV